MTNRVSVMNGMLKQGHTLVCWAELVGMTITLIPGDFPQSLTQLIDETEGLT